LLYIRGFAGQHRMLSRRHRADLLDVDLARDHVMPEPGDDLGEQRD
jgi:hypothetical protein